ncbi:hypothetical protein NE235_04645 [Actinoallomurus spadix]|uniref:Uncharacterized protein n=1 Tax=Actinoallomurus spadix TaxID=79912 RepID=A0ABP3FRT8_9ACTN|nr:hypothetical protein [Actinoallomurus spadix]MCO5985392.1 hypothetical protein [Actinoallomurus spadix]
MTRHQLHSTDQDLVEEQGVNASPGADEEPLPAHDGTPAEGTPPEPVDLLATEPDRRVGLPEQRPGYPGQQRSIETS